MPIAIYIFNCILPLPCLASRLLRLIFFYFICQISIWDTTLSSKNENVDQTNFLPQTTQSPKVSVFYLFNHCFLGYFGKLFHLLEPRILISLFLVHVLCNRK